MMNTKVVLLVTVPVLAVGIGVMCLLAKPTAAPVHFLAGPLAEVHSGQPIHASNTREPISATASSSDQITSAYSMEHPIAAAYNRDYRNSGGSNLPPGALTFDASPYAEYELSAAEMERVQQALNVVLPGHRTALSSVTAKGTGRVYLDNFEGRSILPDGSRRPMFWERIYPNLEFRPGRYVVAGQGYLSETGPPFCEIGARLSVYSRLDLAWFTTIWNTTGSNAMPPATMMLKKTPSGLPLGEAVWMSPPPKGDPGVPTFKLVSHDTFISLRVSAMNEADDALARTVSIQPVRLADIEAMEHIARRLMSAATRAVANFDSSQETTLGIHGRQVTAKVTLNGARVALLSDAADKLGWVLTEEDAVWTATINGRRVILPLAARIAIVDGTEIDLRFPIVQNDDGVWVDVKAFQ